jgi:hypothetical protein
VSLLRAGCAIVLEAPLTLGSLVSRELCAHDRACLVRTRPNLFGDKRTGDMFQIVWVTSHDQLLKQAADVGAVETPQPGQVCVWTVLLPSCVEKVEVCCNCVTAGACDRPGVGVQMCRKAAWMLAEGASQANHRRPPTR